MKLHSFIVAGATFLLAGTAAAQTAPAPAPPAAPAPPWGSEIPAAQPFPGVAPNPAQPVYPPPYPAGAYPPGAYPPGAYPPGAYPMVWPPVAPGQDPSIMGPDGRPRSLPLELSYDPDKGVPPGYRLAEKRRSGLAIAGGVTFLGVWAVSCVAGGFMLDSGDGGGPMYIPLLGPLITIGTSGSSAAGTTALVLDSLAQGAGLGMLIAGMATSQQVLKFQLGPAADVSVQPVAGPLQDGGFAGVTGSF